MSKPSDPIPEPTPVMGNLFAFRVARPTQNWDAMLAFYVDALGLTLLHTFHDHDGYDGALIGLPGSQHQFELTQLRGGAPSHYADRDNLFAFYLGSAEAVEAAGARMQTHGHLPVTAPNPWWGRHGALTFVDPDGWAVVLFPGYTSANPPARLT